MYLCACAASNSFGAHGVIRIICLMFFFVKVQLFLSAVCIDTADIWLSMVIISVRLKCSHNGCASQHCTRFPR